MSHTEPEFLPTIFEKLRLGTKIFELVIASICIGLSCYFPLDNFSQDALIAITFGGYVIILSGVLLTYRKEKIPKKIDRIFTVVGLILFIAAGSVVISCAIDLITPPPNDDHHHTSTVMPIVIPDDVKKTSDIGLAMGSLAIINAVAFLIDLILACQEVRETYTPH